MDMQTTGNPPKGHKAQAGESQFRLLDKVFDFIEKHNWKLFHIASLAFGFLIFLIYFCQNHFYPDFDLFSFVSLLAAAALMGSLMVLMIGFGFTAPGWIWSEAFFSDKPVRKELEYRINNNSPKENLDRSLINRYFFAPGFCCLTILWMAIYFFSNDGSAYTIGLLTGPALTGLVFGWSLQKNYELPPYSWLKFTITAFLVFSIGNLVALLSALAMDKGVPEVAETMGDYPFMGLCFLASLSIFTAIAAVIRKSQRYVLIVSPLLAIMLMLWTNTWSALPDKIVNTLGLGNYQAEQVLLSSDLCEKYKAIEGYGVKDDCALNDVHVIWSMGGLSVIKWQIADHEIKVKIPSSTILSIRLAVPKKRADT
ncbi:hypothetical protein [Pseudomonas sp. Irchel s3a18]|uniref:hypothetical protein n=1 Tax=Pseudomonas sp. Irchel s3a18 TaxID=2009053 RepID=UPI000BA403D3|nr:hypothetical protein [Pseudomonas sp. Irchel s3a18]